jgi:TRAP-type C4-dicarboxylate transport system permease small subunit
VSTTTTSSTKSADPPWVLALLGIDRVVGLLEQAALVLLLGGLIFIGAYQAIGRNFFNHSNAWSFEVLRYSVFFIAMTGAALSAHTKQIIRMDVMTRVLSPRGRAYVRLLTAVFTVGICWLLFQAGLNLRDVLLDERDFALIPPSIGVLAIPGGALLIAFHVTIQQVVTVTRMARGELPNDDTQSVH